MDFKAILNQLSQLSEGTKETPTGKVHKADPGGYGRKFDTDDEGDEKKDDKKKAEPEVKRGRGRPPKTGEHSKSPEEKEKQAKREKAGKELQSFMVGNLPKGKLPGKPSKKHSLKEWVQEIEAKYVAETAPGQQLTVKPMPGAAQLVDPASNKVMATGDAAAVKNIQGAVAQGKVQMRGEEMTEGSEPVASGELLKFAQEKANHMGHQTYPVEYKGRIGRIVGFKLDDTLTIEFADKPGYVFSGIPKNAVTRYQPVQPEKKASMWESDEDYSAKKARAGKDIGKPGKQFAKIAKSAGEKYGSEESGKKVAGAVLAKLRKKVSEADIPSDQVDMGAGLGAGRSAKTFEGKKPDFLDLDKDKNKKEPMSDAAKDAEKKPKKKVSESVHKHTAARLLGKHHALAKEAYNCKYDDIEEAKMYHEGYKEGLDECYGQMPVQGLVSENPMPATTSGMANAALEEDNISTRSYRINDAESFQYACSFDESRCEADDSSATKGIITIEGVPSPELKTLMSQLLQSGVAKPIAGFTHRDITGKARFVGKPSMEEDMFDEGNAFTKFLATHDKGETGTVGGKTFTDTSNYDADLDETFMAFESWDKELNDLLNEGMTVSISKGQQGMPDSVSVSAQDAEADQLLGLIKQAGMGLFGGEDKPEGFAPEVTGMSATGEEEGRDSDDIGVVDDHDGMMALIKKVVGGPQEPEEVGAGSDEGHDHEEEHGEHDHGHEENEEETCNECGMMESKCECDSEQVDEVESYDQEEEIVAEDNAPDSDEAETSADEDAEAKEDEALAKADELNEWANDAGKKGTDEAFNMDIAFITKAIAGGLNKEKATGQTTTPVIAGQNDRMGYSATNESIADWKKLAGLK